MNIEEERTVLENEEYDLLITRSGIHRRNANENHAADEKAKIKKSTNHLLKFLLCSEHKTLDKSCSNCLVFPIQESLPNGKLPTTKQVIGYLFQINNSNNGKQHNNIPGVALDIMLHWITCNVKHYIKKVLDTYTSLKKVPKIKRGETYSKNLLEFISQCSGLFDIKCVDMARLRQQETIWGVKQTKEDLEFYQNQCLVPQVGYCTSFVDQKWAKSFKRKQNEKIRLRDHIESSRSTSRDINEEISDIEVDDVVIDDVVIDDVVIDDVVIDEAEKDSTYIPEVKKGKFLFSDSGGRRDDDMPEKYCYVRYGLRSVKPEIYSVMNTLSSKLHMSKRQIEGSIITIANSLFGREWTPYIEKEESDMNTLPSMKNLTHTEPYFEGGKNLSSLEYATNLMTYLNQARSVTNLTMGDLHNVLTGLTGVNVEDNNMEIDFDQSVDDRFCTGEHLACFWHNDTTNSLEWYLGVVDSVRNGDIMVSFMKRSDKKGYKWLFPEVADLQKTELSQILVRNVPVSYSLTAIIRCEINLETFKKINEQFEAIDS